MSKFYSFKNKILTLITLLSISYVTTAEPWVDTSDIFLRESIEHLADQNIITTPTTTFPLMWHDIAQDLSQVASHLLDDETLNAYYYVRHQLRLAKKSQKRIEVNGANQDSRYTSFGDSYRDSANFQVHTSFLTDHFAFKFSPRYNNSPSDGEKLSYDESYIAAYLGNWVLSFGMQDRWWGPAWDTSLSMTNNARPMPAIALSRKSATPVTIPFTSHKIPWTVTTFMGQMDDDRDVKDTLLWGFRFNFRPTQNWEVGVTRLAQWAGNGRPSDLSTFWDVLKGLDNCGGNGPSQEECAAGQEPGNQMAGYDIRWSTALFNHPIGLYFSSFAEDGDSKGGLSILGEERYQFGFDTRVNLLERSWRVFTEWTDTHATCRDGNNGDGSSEIGDCYYEHHIYQTGMRYNGRTIGSLYESDATSVVFGGISQVKDNIGYQLKLRWLQLNKDNSDKAPENPLIGNTLTPIAEDLLELSGKVQYSYKNWRYMLGASFSESTFENDIKDDTDINIFFNVEYNLK
ncbi:capsule assembly Wzi family protein [Thalassotalea sp. M1531]|uniref:Capsule assembly Wzi family protein n=1 Tax=Thalassotalea algicola TaxID=2716224 RepID=A0A7Y0LDD7_9GAMM|nr:capsule assembly Wzi family protein [Thalassotalea algicola]NMP32242.1 capsule assembly Wzi family protein [Thalassotalea algicola]